jgi:hypothetical protein
MYKTHAHSDGSQTCAFRFEAKLFYWLTSYVEAGNAATGIAYRLRFINSEWKYKEWCEAWWVITTFAGHSPTLLTLRLLMSYMEHLFLMFLNHTQRRSTVDRIPLDEWSALRRDLYLTTHDTHNRQISMPPVGFEPRISVGECRVLSGRGLCDELITRPEESYRLCCVIVYDLETSRIGAPYIYMTLVA